MLVRGMPLDRASIDTTKPPNGHMNLALRWAKNLKKLLKRFKKRFKKMPKSRNVSLSKELRVNLKGRRVNPQNDLHTRYPSI